MTIIKMMMMRVAYYMLAFVAVLCMAAVAAHFLKG